MKRSSLAEARRTVGSIVDSGLCTQCGACVAACPRGAIALQRDEHWRFIPKVDDQRCAHDCPRPCTATCAGFHEDPALWSDMRWAQPGGNMGDCGPTRSAWIGHATEPEIRRRGASGGVVVGLLTHLLDCKRIDGALVVGPNRDRPLQHDIMIARTKSELLDSAGSKYYPLPVGAHFGSLTGRNRRYAVVLLGCHMRSLRLFEQLRADVSESIVLRIGLFCGYCSGFKALIDQAIEWGISDLSSIQRVDFRHGKWPGSVRIQASGLDRSTIIYQYLLRLPFTTNRRCLTCSDMMNETADISVGDAWLPELTNRRDDGWSVMAVRNEAAEELLRSARDLGALHLEPIDKETLIQSQEKPLRFKRNGLETRRNLIGRLTGCASPESSVNWRNQAYSSTIWNRMGNRMFVLTTLVFFRRDRLRRFVLRVFPRVIIRMYVRTIFRMIADDRSRHWLKGLSRSGGPVLNCDA